ncbi:hypothetical protein BBP40_009417 [Aspergillus hancockii]|nr:hypothetical protein BBP40_009417 [Aspergillus hancockii]
MACFTPSSDVLSQFCTALRILVTVVFFGLARESPAFLVQIIKRFSGTNAALLPCFVLLLIPYLLRLVARQLPRDASKYVDESVETGDMGRAMSDFGSDVTVTQNVGRGEKGGDTFGNFERKEIVSGDRTAGEVVRDGDAGEWEGSGGRNIVPSQETTRGVDLRKGDDVEVERPGVSDIECGDEIAGAVDPREGDVETLEKKEIVPYDETPDSINQSIDGGTIPAFPQPQDDTHKPSHTPTPPLYDTLPGKRHCAHWDTAPGNKLYSSRSTKLLESTHIALETKTRPPWAL